MSHDAFVSYRRTPADTELCDTVYRILKSIGYSPYRDVDDLAGGYEWREQLQEALTQNDPKPYVVVLCTKDALKKSNRILEELKMAKKNQLMVVALEFDDGAAGELLMKAGLPYAKSNHYIQNCREKMAGRGLEDALRRTLTHHILRFSRLEKIRVRGWVGERLPKAPHVSFWADEWRAYFKIDSAYRPDSVALIARGGSGKSTLIAQFLDYILTIPSLFPILITEAELRDLSRLTKDLGARSIAQLPEHIDWLSREPVEATSGWKPIQPIFILDGLDQMSSPGDARQSTFVQSIALLSQAAPIIIGCRAEVWDACYADNIDILSKTVPPLDDNRVRSIAASKTPPLQIGETMNPLLRIPLYLDFALQRSSSWGAPPEKETEFLWRIYKDAKSGAAPNSKLRASIDGREWLLKTIAEIQLETLLYEVPLHRIRSHPGYLPSFAGDLQELRNAGVVQEKLSNELGGHPSVRLRHDLLDSFSMATTFLSKADRTAALTRLSDHSDEDCGSSLLAMLIQIAGERNDEGTKHEIFSEMLGVLDRKQRDDRHMARAWAITYALSASFQHLHSVLLDALSGEAIASLEGDKLALPRAQASHLFPHARLTQEAASSLASVFVGKPAAWEDSDRAVTTFSRALRIWPKKARFVEALSRYETNDALAAILDFAEATLKSKDDVRALRYVVKCLGNFSTGRSIDFLKRAFADEELSAEIRRMASESLNEIQPGLVPMSLRTKSELIAGLDPKDERGGYSDWTVVQDAANFIHHRIQSGDSYDTDVLDALVKAMDHDHHHARISVATALSDFDHPAARDALINELLEATLPWVVRQACLSGLKAQLIRNPDGRSKQTSRLLLFEASRIAAGRRQDSLAMALKDLAAGAANIGSQDWITTTGALEVVEPATTGWVSEWSRHASEIDEGVTSQMQQFGAEDVGENQEPKFRIADLEWSSGRLRGYLTDTTWQCGRRFHNAVKVSGSSFCLSNGRWRAPIPLGDLRLPGIAVVHGIIITVDNKLVMAKRPLDAAYAPGSWSASFEEQLTSADLGPSTDPFKQAARRGVLEEFGISIFPEDISVLSLFLEVETLNLAVVTLIRTQLSFAEVSRMWRDEPRPSHHGEAIQLDEVGIQPHLLDSIGDRYESQTLHPTSIARVEALTRFLGHQP